MVPLQQKGRGMTGITKALGAAALVSIVGASACVASSDDAWETFRKDVAAQCLKAAEAQFASATATVDPFGSESYGLALIRGKAKGAASTIAAICVYDKKAKTVEIGGELPES
jgi:hypothetical protein